MTARGTSDHIKGKIYRACVQSVLTYGTETWAMKAQNRQFEEDRVYESEMDVWSVFEGKKAGSEDLYIVLSNGGVAD